MSPLRLKVVDFKDISRICSWGEGETPSLQDFIRENPDILDLEKKHLVITFTLSEEILGALNNTFNLVIGLFNVLGQGANALLTPSQEADQEPYQDIRCYRYVGCIFDNKVSVKLPIPSEDMEGFNKELTRLSLEVIQTR